jgi:lysophospholipase L1-like esterase
MRRNEPTADDHRSPYVPNETAHPWRRMVSIGDSFTEGIGDPIPGTADGHRGWADRVAEVLGSQVDDFAYANLAVRGKLIGQIVADQIEQAVALSPDLVTFSAGGNDVIRPGGDPDAVAAQFEDAVVRLSSQGATVVVFTGIDTNFTPVFRSIRGRVATTASSPTSGRSKRCRTCASSTTTACTTTRWATTRSRGWCCARSTCPTICGRCSPIRCRR